MKKIIITILASFAILFSANQADAQDYETALGLRAAWGFSGDWKKIHQRRTRSRSNCQLQIFRIRLF